MVKKGEGEFAFFIGQIRQFSPIFDFGISNLTEFKSFRRPIVTKLRRVTTGINTEQTRPILSKSEHVLIMANFSSM